MKTKLLIALSFFSLLGKAQAPINSYYPVNGATYALVSALTPIDQSPTGANATWDFTTLTQIGTSVDTNLPPTTAELATFPNTTSNTINTTTIGLIVTDSKVYSRDNAGTISITGLDNPRIELNFATDNALVGTFPLNYGYSNLDDIAGTFTSGNFTGTVNGTINTSVDAYGTLTLNIDGTGETSYQVTRLKSVQSIIMSYGIFGNVGTIDQTLYYYYINGGPSSPIFRVSHTVANVPLQGINNEVYDQLEKYDLPLGVIQNTANTNEVMVYPNPAQDVLHIDSMDNQIKEITIYDMSGRVVLHQDGAVKTIAIGNLGNGIYQAAIATRLGTKIQKIIKN